MKLSAFVTTASFAAVISILCVMSSGQTRKSLDDLNREKARLQSIIEQNNKMMEEYANRRNNEMMKISMVDNKIAKRRALIDVYNTEIEAYNAQIRQLNKQIDSVNNEVQKQRTEYAEMLRTLQARGMNYFPLAYILSSQSLNQSYQRFLFIKQNAEYRRAQFAKLSESIDNLTQLKDNASGKLNHVNQLLSTVNQETKQLDNELSTRRKNVEQIAQNQKDLQQRIAKDQKHAAELEQEIVKVIKEEAEKARREAERKRREAEAAKAREQAKKNGQKAPANQKAKDAAAKAEALADDIKSNKGKLPWPVRSFVITSPFGEHEHPLVPQIKISNNGVDLDILASKDIHPVHKGKVSRIITLPGSNATVIIRHGDVITVYSNLQQVYVKVDQEVDVYTNLGKVYTGDGLNSNILHFEIWSGEQKQNPEIWLRKQ